MVGDSVREELASKISPLAKSLKIEMQPKPASRVIAESPVKFQPPPSAPRQPPSPVSANMPTAEITAKPTSPTLVEFQNKNAVLPEWRLQLQNSVRRRSNGNEANETLTVASSAAPRATLAAIGATALKVEIVEQSAPTVSTNPTLENALRRIEQSRQTYFAEEKPKTPHLSVVQNAASATQNAPKAFPYIVATKTPDFQQPKAGAPATAANFVSKSKPPASLADVKPETEIKLEKFDTNKLPPLPVRAKISSSFEKRPVEISPVETETDEEENKNLLQTDADETVAASAGGEVSIEKFDDEADDRAPVSLRFNAGLFDLIIGSFLSMLLLAPFMLTSGNLFTFQGLLAFLATCSIVMFIYLTTTIGTMGRTFGMRLFSLEIVDIEENAYPTFHQAAVSSSVYLVSLALGGIGFLTLFMNDEKRAAHDLLSGTIVVKEYE